MSLLNFDIQTMLGLLIWVNLSSLVLVLAYVYGTRNVGDKQLAHSIILAKSLLVIAFLLIKYSSGIPKLLSLNLANSLVFCGVLAEARNILYIINKHRGKTTAIITSITFVGIIVYNISIFLWPEGFARISIGATVLIATLVAPTIQLLLLRDPFKLIVGLSYILYIVLMLPRGIFYLLDHNISPDMESALRSLNLLALILLSTFNLPAFLLLMKEDADKRLREMAHTDYLTKLNNRQSFFESTHPMFCRHQREETPCGLIFMDIDHFKQINDTHGHAFGDEVLRTVAAILKSVIRGYDIPCRFGGEEFACFVNNVEHSAIHSLAERIRNMISTTTFQAKPDFNFTISIGVAAGVPGPKDAVTTFIDIADKALYEAKESGRNRVVIKSRFVDEAHNSRDSNRNPA